MVFNLTRPRSSVVLTEEQEMATERIFDRLSQRRPLPFVLHGLAGTGKTTVLAEVAQQIPEAMLCTLTGKAASVLRRKTGLMATTIHAAFYKLIDQKRDKTGRMVLRFEEAHQHGALVGKIMLIDECSMISHRMARDILATGITVVAAGDPGQLPPIEGEPYFNVPDFTLKTIHRQALESPIIRQAHEVRKHRLYQNDGDRFRFLEDGPLTDDDIKQADAILCYRNTTRQLCNERARAVHGITNPWPRAGEPVMCRKNAPLYGVFNGAVYTLGRDFNPGDTSILIDVDEVSTHIPQVFFEPPLPRSLPIGLEETTSFGFGYAMTVHKSQGSEWDSVVIVDECDKPMIRTAWLYTGITRAIDRLTISQFPIGYIPPVPLPF